MGIETILFKIPWTRLLTALPPIVRTARELLQSSHRTDDVKQTAAGLDLQQRVSKLEKNEKIQTELMQKMTEQMQGTTETLQILSARLLVILWLVIIAFLLSATSLILVLRK